MLIGVTPTGTLSTIVMSCAVETRPGAPLLLIVTLYVTISPGTTRLGFLSSVLVSPISGSTICVATVAESALLAPSSGSVHVSDALLVRLPLVRVLPATSATIVLNLSVMTPSAPLGATA